MKRVRFAIDETPEPAGMWASTKHDADPTAQQSLQAIARCIEAQGLSNNAGASAWKVPLLGKLPSTSGLFTLLGGSKISSFKDWLRGFSKSPYPTLYNDLN